MFVRHLGLVDFRSYADVELDLAPGVTTLLGPNGRGKTNLVEAIGYASSLRSHRVATDAPLVRQGASRAIVRVLVDRGGRQMLIELEINPGRANRARLNRSPVPRQRDVLGQLSRVLFAPEDLSLVKGDPSGRRDYLDELLVALAPRYDGVLSDLDRVLRQRNSLLKSASAVRGGGSRSRSTAEQTLGIWDSQLATLSAELLRARLALVERLSGPLARRYSAVAPAGREPMMTAKYTASVPGAEAGMDRRDLAELVLSALSERRDEEFTRGLTLVGPHRDDLYLGLHGMPAKGYASHGESWSMALALRVASYDLLCQEGGPGGEPVLILDDVFAELDAQRRSRLASVVADVEQVLITAAVPDDVPSVLGGQAVEIADGLLTAGLR